MAVGKRAVGDRIKAAIARRGVTQSEVARRLGVKLTTFSNWVTGVTEAPHEQLAQICLLLDVSADEFLGLPPGGPAWLSHDQAHELLTALQRVQRGRAETSELLADVQNAVSEALADEPITKTNRTQSLADVPARGGPPCLSP